MFIIITLFATSAAKKEKRKKNIQIHKQSQQRDYTKVLKNTLSELQQPVIKHIASAA